MQEMASLVDTNLFIIDGINSNQPGITVGHLEYDLGVIWMEPHIILSYLEKNGSNFTKKSMGSLTRQLILDKEAHAAKKAKPVYRRRWPIKIDDFGCFSEVVKVQIDQLKRTTT